MLPVSSSFSLGNLAFASMNDIGLEKIFLLISVPECYYHLGYLCVPDMNESYRDQKLKA